MEVILWGATSAGNSESIRSGSSPSTNLPLDNNRTAVAVLRDKKPALSPRSYEPLGQSCGTASPRGLLAISSMRSSAAMRWAPGFKVKFSSLQGMQQEYRTTGTASSSACGGMNAVQRVIGTTRALRVPTRLGNDFYSVTSQLLRVRHQRGPLSFSPSLLQCVRAQGQTRKALRFFI